MPHEVVILDGFYVPTLLVIFLVSAALAALLDTVLIRLGVYDHVWHPVLFRLCIFLSGAMGGALYVYR